MIAADRMLVRAPSWLGDFVMAEPTLRALAEAYGERLTVAAPRRFFELIEGRQHAARWIALEDGEPSAHWRGHGTALLLTGSLRSALAAARARIPRRIGWFRDARGWLLTDGFAPARERGRRPLGVGRRGFPPRWLPRPYGNACAELAALAGVLVRDTVPRLAPSTAASDRTVRRLTEVGLEPGTPFALACIGARPRSAKGFPPHAWCQTLEAFASACALPLVLACGPGEEWIASQVAGGLSSMRARLLVDPPLSLPELAAACERAAVVLCTDSGPRHLAQAAGAKIAVAMGPTDPRHTADHLERTRVVRVVVPCGPCHREQCPLSGERNHQCMTRIDPQAFARAAVELLYTTIN